MSTLKTYFKFLCSIVQIFEFLSILYLIAVITYMSVNYIPILSISAYFLIGISPIILQLILLIFSKTILKKKRFFLYLLYDLIIIYNAFQLTHIFLIDIKEMLYIN